MNRHSSNKLNALNIFQFAYYWPACGNYICVPIGENFQVNLEKICESEVNPQDEENYFYDCHCLW